MNDKQRESDFDAAVEALPREITPNEDLWPEIHKRISVSSSRFVPAMAIAASLVLLIGGAMFWPQIGGDQWQRGGASVAENYVDNIFIASVGFDMDKAFEKKRKNLLSKFGKDHALTKNWRDQLSELEDARDAIKDSLEENPENFYLLKALQNIHEQQLNLIMRVHDESWQSI